MRVVQKLTIEQARFLRTRKGLPVQPIAIIQRGPDNFGVRQALTTSNVK